MTDWTVFSRIMVVAAIFCLIAVMVLLVPALFDYVYRWLENRRMYAAMRGDKKRSVATDAPQRVQQQVAVKPDDPSALGWSVDSDADSRPTPDGKPEAAFGRGKCVLIADDDPVVMHALSRRLQHLGFQVLRSPDAVHALMGAMKTPIDLIILDVNMPSGNGLAVCEMLGSDPRYAKIPVIIHSVFADEVTRRRAEELGARHIEKSPQSWAKIKQILESLFGPIPEGKAPVDDAELEYSKANVSQPAAPEAAPPAASDVPATSHGDRDDSPAHPPLATSPTCGSARVLCIESPRDCLESVERHLAGIGIEVIRTSDFEEGFWTCFTEKPHVVIIQCVKDPQKLQNLLRRFSEHPVTRSLPLFLVDEGHVVGIEDLYSSITLTVVSAPVEWKDLLEKLEKHLPVFDPGEADPLAAGVPKEPQPAPTQNLSASVAKPSPAILCIDDDPVILKSIAIRLQPYGIPLLTATNGTQGYLTAVKEQPALILLDMKMPKGEGSYVLSKLKENDYTKDVPVIVLTVETHPGIRRKMLAAGAAAYLSKPVRWHELFEEMSHCIELPEQLVRDYKLTPHLTLSQL